MADFEPVPITLPPGIIKGQSGQVARDRYVAGNMVRFWQGQPQRWDGWEKLVETQLDGPARGRIAWRALDGTPCMAFGTAAKLWLWRSGVLHDITPTDEDYVAGFVDTQSGFGWNYGDGSAGGDGWNAGGWNGGFASGAENGGKARTWSLAVWGQDLVANPRGGKIYHWAFDTSTPEAAVPISNGPTSCLGVFVTDDRHLIALGASHSSTPAPLRIAWPNQETLDEWTPSELNTAGDMLLEQGTEIVGSTRVRGGWLVLTDTSAHTMNWVGGIAIFSIDRKGSLAGLIAPHAVAEQDGIAVWMADDGFYMYDGVIRALPSDMHEDIFKNLNRLQTQKIHAGTNSAFRETIWFYPRAGNIENSHFISVNSDGWSEGALSRTSWMDQSAVVKVPVATDADGYIYRQDTGNTADGAVINYTLSSGDVGLQLQGVVAGGENYTRLRTIVPDFERVSGDHNMTIEARRRPMGTHVMIKGPYAVGNTDSRGVKARGRAFRFTLSGNGSFRLGQFVAYARPDGGR